MPQRPNAPIAKTSRSAEMLERASWALKMNHFGDAERLAAEVLKAERGNVLAASLLGQSLLAQNRGGEAIAPLEKAAKRNNDASLETLLAIALAASGLRDDALTQLRRTTARRPVFPPAFRELATQLSKAGDRKQAILVLERCLTEAPQLVELQIDLASLYLGENDRVRAREVLSRALAAAPGRPDAMALQARAMLLDGEHAAAAEAYRHVLAQRPDDAMTRADFAVCLMEMGDRDGGESHLRQIVQAYPQMLYRAVHAMASPTHGRFFLRPSAAKKFLQGEG